MNRRVHRFSLLHSHLNCHDVLLSNRSDFVVAVSEKWWKRKNVAGGRLEARVGG